MVKTCHGLCSVVFLPSQVTSTTETLQFFRSNVFLIFFNLKFVIFLLEYNCFTTLGYFLLYNKVHQLLIYVHCWCLLVQLCLISLQPHGLQPARLLWQWNFPGKNTGVGCHSLLQGIFPTQGLKLHLLQISCFADRFFTAKSHIHPNVFFKRGISS